jgi:L-iditol 2-dehydrogenase
MNETKSSMRAALIHGPRDVKVEQIAIPSPEIGEVLVRIERCGICPSDVRAFEGIFRSSPEYPMIVGHEWTGEVAALGPEVNEIKVGDRVVIDWHGPCEICYFCRRGYPNYCEDLFRRQGGFAEYCLARTRGAHVLPDDMSFDEAAFCEPLACCLNGVETLEIQAGDNVVVIGCGPIGLMHIQLASRMYEARVIGIDLLQERLDKALVFGAQEIILASEGEVVEKVKRLTDGRGANGVVIAVGDPDLVQTAVEMAAPLGVVNVFAGFYPDGYAKLDFNLVHYRQITLTGSHNFLPRHFTGALHAIEIGTVAVKQLISDVLPLNEIENGLNKVCNQEGLKVLIAPNL